MAENMDIDAQGAPEGTGGAAGNSFDYKPEDKANAMLFAEVCNKFERAKKAAARDKYNAVLGADMKKLLGKTSPYPYMRLLLPALDNKRAGYGIKFKSTAKIYPRLMGLAPDSNDAVRLANFSNPEKNPGMAGDFPGTLEDVLKARKSATPSDLTVKQVNELLDELAASDKKRVETVLTKIYRKLSPLEQKWVLRIIEKDMKLGIKHEGVFKYIHPDMLEEYNKMTDLRKVCSIFVDRTSGDRVTSTVTVGQPFHPMLAKNFQYRPQNIEGAMHGDPFLMEVKVDGERMICHKDGDRLQWLTRKGTDYSARYGPVLDKYVCDNVAAGRCILDGEVVSWDDDAGGLVHFGSNRTHALAEVQEGDGGAGVSKWLFYILFDIVYIDDGPEVQRIIKDAVAESRLAGQVSAVPKGGNIVHLPLDIRRGILRRIVREEPHRLELVKGKEVWSTDPNKRRQELLDYFELQAVIKGEEGLVVKDLNSHYVAASRDSGWAKMKPEYSDQTNDLDLIVLGGFYGEGKRRSGVVSHFLLGVAESLADTPDSENDDKGQPRKPQKFMAVGKVGTGYTLEELRELQDRLGDKWLPWEFKGAKAPPHFQSWVSGKAKIRPDVWIPPEESVIFEVKCAEIVPSTEFGTNCTLRFPRVVAIRWDKHWYECLDLRGLEKVRLAPRRSARPGEDAGAKVGRKGRKPANRAKRGGPAVSEMFAMRRMDDVQVEGQVFAPEGPHAPLEICVYSGEFKVELESDANQDEKQLDLQEGEHATPKKRRFKRYTVDEIRDMIVRQGGRAVANPTPNTSFVVVGSRPDIQETNVIKQGKFNVVSFTWVLECVEKGQFLQPSALHMKYMTPEHRKMLAGVVDQFGDSYTDPVDARTLRRVFASMDAEMQAHGDAHGQTGAQTKGAGKGKKRARSEHVDVGGFKLGTPWYEALDALPYEEQAAMDTPYTVFWRNRTLVYLDRYKEIPAQGPSREPLPYTSLGSLGLELELYGGRVSDTLGQDVTHVVTDPADNSRLPIIYDRLHHLYQDGDLQQLKRVVVPDWVDYCISNQSLMSPEEHHIVQRLPMSSQH